MAKEIKAVQCPKCGSTDKLELRTDYFRCLNCNTEYFLDNDEITINHNVRYTNAPVAAAPVPNKKAVLAVMAIALILVASVMVSILTRTHSPSTVSGDSFRWWDSDEEIYESTGLKPILIMMGQRDYSNSDKKGKYISFYDLLTDKEIKSQQITSIPESKSEDIKLRTFANGDIYAIANKSIIFKINKGSYSAEDVTRTIFQSYPQLVTGIANAEFMYDNYGDGFKIMTNEGKTYYLFLLIGKVYTQDEMYAAQKQLAVKEPGAKTRTYFAFSNKSTEFPDEKLQLIKYTQKDNKGGPNDLPRFEWRSSTNYRTNVKTRSLSYWSDALLTYTDLTPGRLYFEPKVLYSDNNFVLVNFNATAAENAPTSVQCINANTGAVIFTTQFTENRYLDYGRHYKDGFVIKSNVSVIVIGMDGKIIREHKFN